MIFLNFWKQQKITIKFVIVTALVIIAVTFVNVFFARFVIKDSILENTKIETANLIQGMTKFHLSSDDFLRGTSTEVYSKFSDFSDSIRTPGIVRIKVWDKNARILFSEDRSIVGKYFPGNAELQESLSGTVEADIKVPEKTENISEKGYRQLIEIYVPVSFVEHSEPVGVIETYYSLDAVNALITKIWLVLLVVNCFAALVLLFIFWKLFQHLIQIPLWRTQKFALEYIEDESSVEKKGRFLDIESNDEIGKVNGAINQMLGRLRDFHGELEEKIKERTADLSQKLAELQTVKKSLQTAKEDLQKFYEAVEGAAEHILITDADGYILYANKAAEDTTGYSLQEMVGQRPSLWGKRMDKSFYEKMWKTIKIDKKSFHDEISNRRKNGESYIADLRISPIVDNHGTVKFFVGIERDITKEKEVDQLKNEFISLASHQLQTPLTAIKWVVERLLKKEKNLSEQGKEYLADILSSGGRLSEFVHRLLNVSRIEEGSIGLALKNIDVIALVVSFLNEIKPMCVAKNIRLVFEEYPKVLLIKTDPIAFQNILQSFAANAIEYTPRDGTITVSIIKKPGTFVFNIADTGIGIPKAEKDKIFSKFGRAANAKRMKPNGSGLGLFIAKHATELLGGRIWFESPTFTEKTPAGVEEGKGSVFSVELPLVSKDKPGARQFI